MASKFERILSEVRQRTTPNSEERSHVHTLADRLKRRLEKAAERAGVEVDVHVEGSIAKDTWLRESPDIDIFMLVSPTENRETFGTLYLKIAKEATKDAEQVERFAEHPYLEAFLDGTRINIVPCYHVKKGEWKSATDRTPFHTDFVKPLLTEELRGEVRLLKQFMKGIKVYGAEIEVGGFSGYLCELLILYYNSFRQALKAASNWNVRQFLDLEGHYEGEEDQLRQGFVEPLVMVDPVDRERNAASAVRQDALSVFVAASRTFLEVPSRRFFFPSETEPFTSRELLESFRNRGTSFIFVRFGKVDAVSDVFWGQLYKSQRSLRRLINHHGFNIVRDAVWSDERSLNFFLIELKHGELPILKKHLGPPLDKKEDCRSFLKKHVKSTRTLSGPRIECGRWVVSTSREYTAADRFLEVSLKDGGRNVGVAEHISRAMVNDLKILVDEEILSDYSQNPDFARFLTDYIRGKPKWLT